MRLLFIFILLLHVVLVFSQKIKVKTQSVLPDKIIETSGLIAGTKQTIWTHNDSGGEPRLYQLDKNGDIVRELYIENAKNIDWEDLANDYKGYVYIADIGNNLNNRKDLCIYKIPHPDSILTDTIVPELISFSYPNQKAFPPQSNKLNFDAEALIAYQDSLFIFTKNRTKPYTKYTYVYAIKNQAGYQQAVLRDSIYLAKTKKYRSWVTGVERHPYKGIIVLISHKKAWIIEDFRKKSSPKVAKAKISGLYSQKEAIAFDLEGDVWITNEKFKFLRAKLKKGYIK